MYQTYISSTLYSYLHGYRYVLNSPASVYFYTTGQVI